MGNTEKTKGRRRLRRSSLPTLSVPFAALMKIETRDFARENAEKNIVKTPKFYRTPETLGAVGITENVVNIVTSRVRDFASERKNALKLLYSK